MSLTQRVSDGWVSEGGHRCNGKYRAREMSVVERVAEGVELNTTTTTTTTRTKLC